MGDWALGALLIGALKFKSNLKPASTLPYPANILLNIPHLHEQQVGRER